MKRLPPFTPPRLVVGISGASGVVYGVRLLQQLRALGVQTHLVMSRGAKLTLLHETALKLRDVQAMADVCYRSDDLAAPIASGSFRTLGMVVAPCSMRSLAEIAQGLSSSLLTRAADVALKERRRLVLLARETPLTCAHLRNMLAVTEMGGIIAPPVPAFYARPRDLDAMIEHTLRRVLDLFDLHNDLARRWGEGMPSHDVGHTTGEPA